MDNGEYGDGERVSEVLLCERMARSAETFFVDVAADNSVAHAKLDDKHTRQADFFRRLQGCTPDFLQHLQSEMEPTNRDA